MREKFYGKTYCRFFLSDPGLTTAVKHNDHATTSYDHGDCQTLDFPVVEFVRRKPTSTQAQERGRGKAGSDAQDFFLFLGGGEGSGPKPGTSDNN